MLVRGSWWRVFGVSLVVVLVITGMGILLTIPFAWVSDLVGLVAPNTLAGLALTTLNSIVVGVAVLPVAFTAMTLLYYDLRVRREHFNLEVLSQEMRVAST
jgi:fatty acid desaturase